MIKLCDYGCGQEAKFQFKNGKWCCSKSQNSCSGNRRKNSESTKESWKRTEIKEKRCTGMVTVEAREKHSRSAKKTLNEPIVKEKRCQSMRKTLAKPEVKKKYSESSKKSWSEPIARKNRLEALNEPELRKKHSIFMKEFMNRPEIKFKQIQYMLKGGALKANAGIKNPSKPQVKLFKLALQISPYSILNYPVYSTNYSIDVALLPFSIAIEYDESYWHQDKEKDLRRQKILEEQGWRFLRYRDYVPNLKQLSKDIDKIFVGEK